MTPSEIKKKVLAYKDWEWWAERPFGAFVMSMFAIGEQKKYTQRLGANMFWPVTLWQKGAFYKSEKVWDEFAAQIEKYLKSGGSIYKIVRACEKYRIDSERKIARLIRSKQAPLEKFEELFDILCFDIAFVWMAHGLEHYYKPKIYKEASRYFRNEELEKFVGDISYPSKKNAHHYLERALRGRMPLAEVQRRFGWIKVRDGFSDPFSIRELRKERERLKKIKVAKFKAPKIPRPLMKLAKVAQELVYYRTFRTDVLYEIMWKARPILKEVAAYYKIPFKQLIDYSGVDLLAGKPRKYPRKVTFISYHAHYAFFDKPILNEVYANKGELKGVIANHGTAIGKAKIVKTAYEIDKVKKGDILFAPTTAPSFILGMKRASAFVTDEGGITSHAAIVSREMNKPCIIGTKIGTKIFHDGDLVEVDANKGVVKRLD